VIWSWDGGVRDYAKANNDESYETEVAGGPFGLLVIAVVVGVIVAKALGDLGSIDDNLSLPIISGCY